MSYLPLDREHFDKDPGLKQLVSDMMRGLSPTISGFGREKHMTYDEFGDMYQTLTRTNTTAGHQVVTRRIDVTPTRNDSGQLGVAVRPYASKVDYDSPYKLSVELESYPALPNRESVRDALERAYQTVRSVKPTDINAIDTDLMVLAS